MGRVPAIATRNDLYTALAMTVRDRVFRHGVHTIESLGEQQARKVAYLSAEYLPGPHVALNLLNLGIADQMRQAVSELGYDLDALLEQEEEPGLGNGGLGRLASCYVDSLATLQIPAIGNLLRLWKAEAVESFDFDAFHRGDYYRAVEEKMESENITKVLYPNDEPPQGKTLRLQQQFFFVSCSLQDMLRVHRALGGQPENFHQKLAIQLNDTHPAIAAAELMRLLVDEYELGWDTAWDVTCRAIAYTNHTLLPEALEKWPVGLFGQLLPRHLQIIYEINRRFLDEVRAKYPGDHERIARMSLIDESGERYVRMANLATVAGHHVNGVAQLHSSLLKKTVLYDFAALWPEKFCNVTNGVNPRRFVAVSNPGLAKLITDRIGDGWLRDLRELRRLEVFATDADFQARWRGAKLGAKQSLAALVKEQVGVEINPQSLFDILSKRIHEYKRQHLNVLHILTLYLRLKRNARADIPARTFLFGGKAAPGYFMAKLIIKLINAVATFIDNARMGKFSSDRSIGEYCERIWNVKPVRVEVR
jgi:glycogen phosphorylase